MRVCAYKIAYGSFPKWVDPDIDPKITVIQIMGSRKKVPLIFALILGNQHVYIYTTYVYIYIYVCTCIFVCVWGFLSTGAPGRPCKDTLQL